jgi:radical SAM protein with 4Fe4S-binding SPASM domain
MNDYLNLLPQEFNSKDFEVIVRTNAIKQEIEGKHHYEKCRATPNFWVYSMADGGVFTCSAHLMDNRFSIGNLNTQSFREIWEGNKRKQNWELMKDFDIKQCRLNCRMNGQNQYLYDLEHAPHSNFL